MRRLAMASVVGAATGLLAALVSGMAFDQYRLIGEWGTRNGVIAAAIAFLATLGRGGRWPAILARWLVVAVVGLVAYGITWWTVVSGAPPWSYEGVWLWPVALVALSGWLLAVRWAWRGRTDRAGGGH